MLSQRYGQAIELTPCKECLSGISILRVDRYICTSTCDKNDKTKYLWVYRYTSTWSSMYLYMVIVVTSKDLWLIKKHYYSTCLSSALVLFVLFAPKKAFWSCPYFCPLPRIICARWSSLCPYFCYYQSHPTKDLGPYGEISKRDRRPSYDDKSTHSLMLYLNKHLLHWDLESQFTHANDCLLPI